MAPHKFWLKRQLPGLPDLDDLPVDELPDLPGIPIPTPSTTSSGGASASVSSQSQASPATSSTTSSSSSSQSVTPTPSSTSSTREDPEPTPSTPLNEQSDVILIQSSSTSSTPTSALPTSTLVQNKTVVVEDPAVTPGNVSAAKNSFLENKVLSGVVFGLCGLVGLIIIIVLIFFITRKARRNRQLEQEIISWDPDHVQNFNTANRKEDEDGRSIQELEEKGRSPGSLDGHYTYTLPSNNPHANPNSTTPYSDYGVQRPIHVALPNTGGYGSQQAYRGNW